MLFMTAILENITMLVIHIFLIDTWTQVTWRKGNPNNLDHVAHFQQ